MADSKKIDISSGLVDDPNDLIDLTGGMSPEAINAVSNPPPQVSGLQDFVNSSARAVGKTILGVGGLASPKLRELANAVPEPNTTAGEVGKFAGNMATMFAPGGLAGKATQAIANPLLRNAAKLGIDAGITGVIGAGQAGGDIEKGLIDASITAGLGTLGTFAGMLMSRWGKNVQMKGMMPRATDWKEGFKYETVKDLGLKGNLQDSYRQVVDRLSSLKIRRDELLKGVDTPKIDLTLKSPGSKSAIELTPEKIAVIEEDAQKTGMLQRAQDQARQLGKPIPTRITDVYDVSVKGGVNLDAALKSAREDLTKAIAQLKHVKIGPKIMADLTEMENQIRTAIGPLGFSSVEMAENAKESIGLLGAWAYGSKEMDANATEIAANTLYSKIRQAIEDAMPNKGELRLLNSHMQKLIPVRNAMIARIPVEERNSIASLADITAMIPTMLTGNPIHAALPMFARMQKSMRTGNWLTRTAPNAPQTGVNLGRALSMGLSGE